MVSQKIHRAYQPDRSRRIAVILAVLLVLGLPAPGAFAEPAAPAGGDPAASEDPAEWETDALNEKKEAAAAELRAYKERDSYYEEDREEYDEIVETGVSRIMAAAAEPEVDRALADAKAELDLLLQTEGDENRELLKRVYFRSSDGKTTVQANGRGIFELTAQDEGTFYVKKDNGKNYANNMVDVKWNCVVQIGDSSGYGWNYIIGGYGQFQPRVTGTFDATCTVRDLSKTIRFRIRITNGAIDQLRAMVDGKDVSGGTVRVKGSEGKRAVIQGRLGGTDRWVDIPLHALVMTPRGAVNVDHSNGVFQAWGESGSMTYSLATNGKIKVSFDIRSDIVRVTGLDVYVPDVCYIDFWTLENGGQFIGVMEGDADEKDRYHVTVYPGNATNPSVIWEALTPDIATQSDLHSHGIVPKKAGTAEFIVRSVDDPTVFKKVYVKFVYRNALRTAAPDQNVYYLKKGETKYFDIITNGKKNSREGASDQRFRWSYNPSGVAAVSDKIIPDATLSGAKICEHKIVAQKEGVTYVTGTPYDSSEGCKPVQFKIIVSANPDRDREAARKVEEKIRSIGPVTLDKKQAIRDARAAFGQLSAVQKDMVDDSVYALLVAAELRLGQLEREQNEGRQEDPANPDPDDNSDQNDGGGAPDEGDPGDQGIGASEGEAGGGAGGGDGDGGETGRSSEAEGENRNGRQATGDRADGETAAMSTSEKAVARDGILAQEVDLDQVRKELGKAVREMGRQLVLMLLFLLSAALFYGGQRKYREFRKETR